MTLRSLAAQRVLMIMVGGDFVATHIEVWGSSNIHVIDSDYGVPGAPYFLRRYMFVLPHSTFLTSYHILHVFRAGCACHGSLNYLPIPRFCSRVRRPAPPLILRRITRHLVELHPSTELVCEISSTFLEDRCCSNATSDWFEVLRCASILTHWYIFDFSSFCHCNLLIMFVRS